MSYQPPRILHAGIHLGRAMPGHLFQQSLALSAHVSPQTIHFHVLDKSQFSGSGRDLPFCNRQIQNVSVPLLPMNKQTKKWGKRKIRNNASLDETQEQSLETSSVKVYLDRLFDFSTDEDKLCALQKRWVKEHLF